MPLRKQLWLKDKRREQAAPIFGAGLRLVCSKWVVGLVLVMLLVLFLVQNGKAVHVHFIFWETDLSQSVVVLLALLFGVVLGVALTRWLGWRWSRTRGGLQLSTAYGQHKRAEEKRA